MTGKPLDLGHGHLLTFVGWHPQRTLNPQFDGVDDVDRWGAEIEHPAAGTGRPCVGFVTFDGPTQRALHAAAPKWTVESLDPLTLSPSVLCTCGDHGFIREGRWVPA